MEPTSQLLKRSGYLWIRLSQLLLLFRLTLSFFAKSFTRLRQIIKSIYIRVTHIIPIVLLYSAQQLVHCGTLVPRMLFKRLLG
jgi:hypothetical protein